MKKCFIPLILLFSMLWAYDLDMGGLGAYTIFDPDSRESLLVYPKSWLKPSQELFDHDYQDSSSTYAKWDQYLALDFTSSNNIVTKYTPYSSPHRWSAGLQFINYSTINPTSRNDAVLHYKNERGELEYYHTSNTQTIDMATGKDTKHIIKANGLNFKYSISDKFKLLGDFDLNLIEQFDDSSRTYNINHDHMTFEYMSSKYFMFYGKFNYWYWVNEDQQGREILFYPGIKFSKGILLAHFSLRVSNSSVMPNAEIKVQSGVFHLHTYLKTRSPRIALDQAASQYIGVNTGIDLESNQHKFRANIQGERAFLPAAVNSTLLNYHFYFVHALAEYSLKLKNIEAYSSGKYYYSFKCAEGFYHPEIANITLGLKFSTPIAKKKLMLSGDINAQYIIHEDPNNVSFDPSKLFYTRIDDSLPVDDWQINFNLNARVQTLLLSAIVSLPLDLDDISIKYFNYGFKTSSDLSYGHGAYAGLRIEWLWWK